MTTIPFATRTTCPDCGADVIAVHQDSTTVLADKVWSSSRGGGSYRLHECPEPDPYPRETPKPCHYCGGPTSECSCVHWRDD